MQTPAIDILEARKEAGMFGDMGRAALMTGALAGGAHGVESAPGGGYTSIGGSHHTEAGMARNRDNLLADTGHPLASYATGGILPTGTLPTGHAMDAANATHRAIKARAAGEGGLIDPTKLKELAPHSLPVLNAHLQGRGLPTVAPYAPAAIARR